jgi:glutamyl-tRNA synthetase
VSTSARVRFAPSPTGYLHLGSARAALFNWLAARHLGGKFLLRIEDTDKERSRPELIDVIYEGLEWLGLDWDEEPLHQSTRDDAHQEAIQALVRDGAAYESEGAVRFRVPDDGGSTGWVDLIRGEISVEHANIEDFVIRRSDGSPTFFLANASDDAHMGITHVIRGEDLINVTPKYLLLRRAMGIGGPDPEFAHMPLIVNEQRKKLSKRRDDVSLMDYRDRGFLASAMVNYLALLGWGPPDGQEVRFEPLSLTDGFPPMFDIGDVSSSPAFFDVKKLLFVNAEHLRALPLESLDELSQPYLAASTVGDAYAADPANRERFRAMLPEVQTRVETLSEVPDYVDFLFVDQPEVDQKAWDKAMVPDAAGWLDAVIAAAEDWPWQAEALHERFMALAEELGANRRKFQAPVRVALTGRSVGPPLFEAMVVLGRDVTLARLRAARARLGSDG